MEKSTRIPSLLGLRDGSETILVSVANASKIKNKLSLLSPSHQRRPEVFSVIAPVRPDDDIFEVEGRGLADLDRDGGGIVRVVWRS